MENFWKSRAEEALRSGYPEGNEWQRALHRHLLRTNPNLVAELQASREFHAYLVVRTNDAMNRAHQLEEQGTPPATARELALDELLTKQPEPPAPWETAAAVQDVLSAVAKHLENLSQQSRRPTTQPTPPPATGATPAGTSSPAG
jgi:hypothetical protein